MDSSYRGVVLVGGHTRRHTQLMRKSFQINTCQKLASESGIRSFPENQKEAPPAPSTIGMKKKGVLWSPSERRINQPTRLLSIRLQINPNFRSSVHEFLIHHTFNYSYINFIG